MNALRLRTTDGTQMSYAKVNNEWRCTEVKDRNGNYLSATYHWWGQINQVTDTPGRVLTFVYDSKKKITKITQQWAGGATQNWARFEYHSVTLNALFGGYQMVGARNGQVWPVLNRVLLPDDSSYFFTYNTQGQVKQIDNRAAAVLTKLNHVRYSIGDGPLVDRVSEARVWADDWNGEAESAPTSYAAPVAASWTTPHNGATRTGLKSIVTGPDATQTRLYYADAGWQRGLVELTQTVVNNVVERWSTTDFTADNGVNPRPTETNVGDPLGNRRRATIAYDSYGYGLPSDVREWTGAGGATLYRSSHTDYQWDGAYTSRRIIGLPAAQYACDGAIGETAPCGNASGASLTAKVTYKYDDPAWTEHLQAHSAAATQHDAANYGPGFTVRGNLYETARWDVTAPNDTSKIVENKAGYYITGTPRFTRANGPNGWEQVTLDYADQFSDGVNPPVGYNTFTYPTTVTDPDGFQSKSEYRYDFGAPVKATGPPPAGQSQGAIARRVYDSIGRLEKVRTELNGNADYSYTRWTYPATGNMVNQYTTITDGAGEAYSFTKTDGLGRTLFAVTDHPGSDGLHSTVATEYDALGRPWKQSVPTETNAQTVPTGDDANGYLYRTRTYDWKGRPLVSTNTDGTQTEASYGGCGCAGGEVVTLIGEDLAPPTVPPAPPNPPKRRKQMIYSDSLGRSVKTETYNWPAPYGDGAVYTSTVNEYNARDQVRFVKQYQGTATAGNTFQQQEIQYDGHGRQKQVHLPQFDLNAWTVYEYNANDTLQSVTDPRGAKTTYTYNNRKMVTQKHYSDFTPAPADENFFYDAAGNRTSMQDGTGTLTYAYDQLSRPTSETRIFNGLSNSYTFNYGYNRSGQLASVSDPFGGIINYNHDATGRMSDITGTGFGSVTNFMSGLQYRAWGAKKHFTTGNGVEMNLGYNARLAATGYTVSNLNEANSPASRTMAYSYEADGRLKFAGLGTAVQPAFFDRAFTYDQAGRIKDALSGNEAHGLTTATGPYKQNYGYDVWGNTTTFTGRLYDQNNPTQTNSFTNGRHYLGGYDAAGHLMSDFFGRPQHKFDAAERQSNFASHDEPEHGLFLSSLEIAQSYDGSGSSVKQTIIRHLVDYEHHGEPFPYTTTVSNYYLRSSVLNGQVIAEIHQSGQMLKRYVYAEGLEIADFSYGNPIWKFTDPAAGTKYSLNTYWEATRVFLAEKELDPLGTDITNAPEQAQQYSVPVYLEPRYQTTFLLDGGPTEEFLQANAEAAVRGTAGYFRNVAEGAWKAGNRGMWEWALAQNPNAGLEVRTDGRNFNLYGADAAGFLGNLADALAAGRLVAGDAATRAAHGEIYAQESLDKNNDNEKYKDGLTSEQEEVLNDAASIAKSALENSDCADFIKGASGYDPTKILEAFLKEKRYFHGGTPGSIATTYGGYGSPSLAYIGLRNLFFQSNVGGWAAKGYRLAGIQLNTREARAETILHELIHALQPFIDHPTGNKADDKKLREAGYTLQTKEYFNSNIRKKCIAPLRKRGKKR